jgi:hypothetical protein
VTPRRIFILNGVIAAGYGIALVVAAGPILDVYGISPTPEAMFMGRWFGLGLLANGLITLLTRDFADGEVGRAIALALMTTYGFGIVLALSGTLLGPFNLFGWIAVALNVVLGSAFAFVRFRPSGPPTSR